MKLFSLDVESIKAAQKTCDRILNGIREIAVAEKLETTVCDLIALVVGDEFDFSTESVWSWKFPTIIRTPSDLQIILLASFLRSSPRSARRRSAEILMSTSASPTRR
jgi:hypothetical protein